MAIRGILFDKDGTIIDYWRTWVPINREAALYAARGDQGLADKLLGLGGHDPATNRVRPGSPLAAGDYMDIANAFAAHPAIGAAADLAAGIERIFRERVAGRSALLPGTRETLAELKRRGFRLGLATNDSVAGIAASLGQHDVLGFFEFKAGFDSGHGTKPDPGMVTAFCDGARLRPMEVAVVGDAEHDLMMGRAAGVGRTIGVLSGTSQRQDLEAYADVIVDSVNDLLELAEFRE